MTLRSDMALSFCLLVSAVFLRVTHACAPGAFVAAAALLAMAAALDRPAMIARLPLSLGLLVLLCPADLQRHVLALPGAVAAAAVLLALVALTMASSLVCALCRKAPSARWLRAVTIESAVGAAAARAEISLAWFALARWRARPSDIPATAAPFGSGAGTDVAMAWIAAASGLVEAPILHVVLRHFSVSSAWASTGLTLLIAAYFMGFAKSLALWPTLVFPDRLLIRLGAVLSQSVLRSDIEDVRILGASGAPLAHVRLYAFEPPNVAIRAGGRNYAFRVDHPDRLLAALHAA